MTSNNVWFITLGTLTNLELSQFDLILRKGWEIIGVNETNETNDATGLDKLPQWEHKA